MRRGSRAGGVRAAVAGVLAALLVLVAPAPAVADFSIPTFWAISSSSTTPPRPLSAPAASHPDSTVHMEFDGDEHVRDIIQHFPGGIIPNPNALPKCTMAQFQMTPPSCPANSQLGTTKLTATPEVGLPLQTTVNGQVYNLDVGPPWAGGLGFVVAGQPLPAPFTVRSARFGAVPDWTGAGTALGDPPGLTTSLADEEADIDAQPIEPTARDYGLTGLSVDVPDHLDLGLGPVQIHIDAIEYTLDGTPAGMFDLSKPYLTTTTACLQGYPKLQATSHENPTTKVTDLRTDDDDGVGGPSTTDDFLTGTDCDEASLPYNPEPLGAVVETSRTDTPSGYDVSVNIPANENWGADTDRHQPYLKRGAITLPPGTALSPPAADGLEGCTDSQLGFGTQSPPACPAASDIGDVTVESKNACPAPCPDPENPDPLEGEFYLGEPLPGHTYRVFIAFPIVDGLWIKLDGESFPDPVTGQVTTVFDDLPMLPFEKLTLSTRGGNRAVLVNPSNCGTHTLTSALTPWSGATTFPPDRDEHPEGTFGTSYDGAGAGCPDPFPFDPAVAGSSNPLKAGANSSLALTLSNPDRDQLLKTLKASLPAGLVGSLTAVPLCSVADAAGGTCADASKIGTVATTVGSGPSPLPLPGSVYLAQPLQSGDPASLSIVVPAKAGPFDFGNVITRARIVLRTDVGLDILLVDDLPRIIGGIPIRVRDVSTNVDKANFTRNPTSCAPLQFSASFTSLAGAVKTTSSAYQATDCNALPFSPTLRFVASGEFKKNGHPTLQAIVTQPPGQANIAKSVVVLPSALKPDVAALQRPGALCAESLAAVRACPPSSQVGVAKASTPLLPEPLSGPVYIVQYASSPLPKLLILLDGRVSIQLQAQNELQNLKIVNRFDSLPDVPVSRFELTINGGTKGILLNGSNLCGQRARGDVTFTAHSGKTFSDRPAIEAPVCASKTRPTASITLKGVRSGKPRLTIRARRAAVGARLRELRLKLPKGLRVRRANARRGVRVKAARKSPRPRWSLTRKGVLKVRARSRGAASVTAILGKGVLRSTPSLRKKLRGKKRPRIVFRLRVIDVKRQRFTVTRRVRPRT